MQLTERPESTDRTTISWHSFHDSFYDARRAGHKTCAAERQCRVRRPGSAWVGLGRPGSAWVGLGNAVAFSCTGLRGEHTGGMTMGAWPGGWSPADNPYAIALSEAQWNVEAVGLGVRRILSGEDPERQIDARQLIYALRQTERFAVMEQRAITDKVPAAARALGEAIEVFRAGVPGARDARDVLEHYDEYSQGEGRAQRSAITRGKARDLARQYSRFGYDPGTGQIQVGPFQIGVNEALIHARRLLLAIHIAAQSYDSAQSAAS
jgi:hypothetical protein